MRIINCNYYSIYLCFSLIVILFLESYQLNLTILHNNDFHSHFEEMDVQDGDCTKNQSCYGGIARTVSKVHQIRQQHKGKDVLFLNAGDNFAGTIWYTLEKWRVEAEFIKLMRIDVMTLGNHEFDDGFAQLVPYLKEIECNELKNVTVVCSNIKSSKQLNRLYKTSVVIKKGGRNIAIVGYITPSTKQLSLTGKTVEFDEEIESLRKEIKKLKKEHGDKLNIFIAIGHSGFDKDKEIAQKIPDLDVVVGGHSNTFLYTGTPPSIEKPAGVYPIVIDHKGGAKTLVVQAFMAGKYLGKLDVSFDKKGIITSYGGNPILLDEKVKEDPKVLAEVKKTEKVINFEFNQVMGNSSVDLDFEICQTKECPLGSMFNDAFMSYFSSRPNVTSELGSKTVSVSVYNGGSIRTSIAKGNITRKILISSLPFSNYLGIVKVNGSKLWEIMEYSASQYNNGGFLQVSGMKYCFDSSQPIGQRLQSVSIRCTDCKTEVYNDLDLKKTYSLLLNDYLINGGNDFTMLKGFTYNAFKTPDYELSYPYIQAHSPISTAIDGRIIDSKTKCTKAKKSS